MKRVRQSFDEIVNMLLPVEVTWMDEHATEVIEMLKAIPLKNCYVEKDVRDFLENNFKVGLTVIRLFLDLSKDEFTIQMKDAFTDSGGIGIQRYQKDKKSYLEVLTNLGLLEKIKSSVHKPLHWSDTLIERLKGGRGSAIKGQQRGRKMEDFVENIIKTVFDDKKIAPRCRFTGANGKSTEKTDFAIPNADDPHILIEVKAYGATGSKQTDVLGDIHRIVEEKRNDTIFFLFTDGITWKERASDLKKLIDLQNQGKIQKIYTQSMADELKMDLLSLKREFDL